jgi:hypothetical protein
MKIEGSGSSSGSGSESGCISQRHGFPDPDPHQHVMDPQHCLRHALFIVFFTYRTVIINIKIFCRGVFVFITQVSGSLFFSAFALSCALVSRYNKTRQDL